MGAMGMTQPLGRGCFCLLPILPEVQCDGGPEADIRAKTSMGAMGMTQPLGRGCFCLLPSLPEAPCDGQ